MLSFQEKLATLSHIVTMADFAMAMKKKLADINLHSFNDFKMKIGKCNSGITVDHINKWQNMQKRLAGVQENEARGTLCCIKTK